MLEWTSNVWGKLMGPYGSGTEVPAFLQQLTQEYHQERADELFQEYLFHQNTIYTVTYAAVPYLVHIACSTEDLKVQCELFITCGIIEASRDHNEAAPFPATWMELAEHIGASTCTDIYSEYLKAIRKIALLGPEVLAYATHALENPVEKRYILSANAAYQGLYTLANMLLTFTMGDEYVVTCPKCKEEMYLWPNEDDTCIQAFTQDPVFNEEQNAHTIIPATKFSNREQKILQEQAQAIGEDKLIRHLPYLASKIDCPSCHITIQIWPSLLSLFES
ncbi:hypothetical protein I6G82_17575 [Lysinibacillus macroides]|uniref:Uncharacterized protein n=1 Tax=Lysinibacillus macroides TaxID=33935 RepID=A0A0N0CWX5_9BACI|nr:hypothetical protein [Lysinibacillus macroides]KOY83781.1 hypothetical protein ADM90_02460 [Lysinibacillus macroides]QPR67045.1 hypothetical protein I6G82_17575 [Lysinibacillus macroides]